MNDELEGIQNEVVMAYLKVRPQHLLEETEKNHESRSQASQYPN
jgi:hypothetical protein